MSYILKALRKSENDRLSNQQQTLENNIMEHNEQIKFSWLPLFIVSIILINLAFLVIFWINKEISAEKFSRHPNTSIDHEQPMVQSKQKEPRLHNVGNMPKPSDRNNQENREKKNQT